MRGPQGRHPLRGPRRGRQGRRHQAHHAEPQPARRPGRGPARPHGAREDAVVLPALRRPPAGGRRDGPLRPQLVQPGRRRPRHGLRHRGRGRGVLPLLPGVRAHARALGDHPHQVLVLGQRRGAGATLPGPHRRPHQALEAQPHGPAVTRPLGGVLAGQGRDVPPHRHQAGALVRRQRRRQAPRPAQRHQPPALAHPLPGPDARSRSSCRRASPTRATCVRPWTSSPSSPSRTDSSRRRPREAPAVSGLQGSGGLDHARRS